MMNDTMQTAWGVLAVFVQSDLGPDPAPQWFNVGAVQMAHMLFGTGLALFRASKALVGAFFALWTAKELLGDIPNAGGAWLVVADSVADPCFGALGYFMAKMQMEKTHDNQT